MLISKHEIYLLIGIIGLLIVGGGWQYLNQSSAKEIQLTTPNGLQLAMHFDPADSWVAFIGQRKTADGTLINEVVVTPPGEDPTKVHFFSTTVSLEEAKNLQIHHIRPDHSYSEFVDATIDGIGGIRRIDHNSTNDCTREMTIFEKNGVVYGSQITQCPTHPAGYDQLRRNIADSLRLRTSYF